MINQNSQFLAILTDVGAAKQANADALGLPWKITAMGVGDANDTDPVPSTAQKTLINERRRAPLNQLKVDPNNPATIIAEQVIPPEVGGWWIREIGLYDADGDLVAVANCAPTFKPLLTQGAGRTQVVRLNLLINNASNVELKIDPSVVLATREYVDRKVLDEVNKLDGKQSVRVSATANIALSGLPVLDTVQVAPGDRVFAPFQTSAKDRGIYIATAVGRWGRATDANTSHQVTPGMLVTVEEGATYAESIWELTTDAPIVLGTTALTFEMISGATVGPGEYRQVTVNRRGIVIAGYNPTTLSGYGITDAYTKTVMDSITSNLANNITGVNAALTTAIGKKFDKAGGTVTGIITLTDGSSSSPALRMNNTSWNTYLDLFRDQLRLYADQGGSVIYPLVFDLTNKSASLFGGTVWTSINRPKNTASWGVNGWHRDSDTGKLEVWGQATMEVPNAVGSVATLTVTFVTAFPVEVSSVTFGKVAGDASEVVENEIGFYNLTNSGMTISAKRVAGAQTGGERVIVHYRVFGR